MRAGSIDSERNDWEAATSYAYWFDDLSNCQNFQATGGVSSIKVKHSGDDGVCIDYWRIITDSGVYYCHGGWYDDNYENTITCYRGKEDEGNTC